MSITVYAFMDQEDIGPGNGLMVKIWLSVGGGKTFQAGGKPAERFQDGIALQIYPDNPDVVLMMKVFAPQRATFEALDELFIFHC
jgi:hypothetical protein